MNEFSRFSSLVCLLFLAGCGLDGPLPEQKHEAPPAASKSVEQKPAAINKAAAKKDAIASKPAVVRVPAAAGVGEKGRGYGGDMVTVSVMALWGVREKLTFDQMQHALDIYKAMNDGHAPKTQEEFMKEIVKPANLRLPELPAGSRYVYDPATGQLMVEKPRDPDGF